MSEPLFLGFLCKSEKDIHEEREVVQVYRYVGHIHAKMKRTFPPPSNTEPVAGDRCKDSRDLPLVVRHRNEMVYPSGSCPKRKRPTGLEASQRVYWVCVGLPRNTHTHIICVKESHQSSGRLEVLGR